MGLGELEESLAKLVIGKVLLYKIGWRPELPGQNRHPIGPPEHLINKG